jgi:hypothetical protein
MAESLLGKRTEEEKPKKKPFGLVSFFGNLVGRSAT